MDNSKLRIKTAGLETCPSGWMSISFDEEAPGYRILREPNELAEIIETANRVFIHIPIGLQEDRYTRECDELLIKWLGSISSDQLIPPPIRPVLKAPSFVEASMQSFEFTERELSTQTWNIIPRIREIDNLLREKSEWREKVFESHPELLCMRLNGGIIYQNKQTRKGLRHRLNLISEQEPVAADFFREIKDEFRRNEVAEEDIVNAMAMAYAARRSMEKEILSLPEDPPVDSMGLKMAIHYI